MPIADQDALLTSTLNLMGGVADSLAAEAKTGAVGQAISELGWTFPLADGLTSYWAIERTKRHLLFILMTIASNKFQYKQIHLEHRFKHLNQLIVKMDADFLAFVDDHYELFDAVASTYDDFASYIMNGFVYDVTGYDITLDV